MLDSIFTLLQPLSDSIGTGDIRGDLTFFVALLLIAAGIILGFFIISSGRKNGRPSLSKQTNKSQEGFDRLASIAGRFEKLEMNVNKSRTEVLREIEFLKVRIENLEQQLGGKGVDSKKIELDSKDKKEGKAEANSESAIKHEDLAVSTTADSSKEPFELAAEIERTRQITEFMPLEDRAELIEEGSKKKELTSSNWSGGLKKTRSGLFQRIKEVFSLQPKVSEETLEELKAFLISTDLGVLTVGRLIDDLRANLSRGDEIGEEALLSKLNSLVFERLNSVSGSITEILPKAKSDGPLVVLMVGVNGVGKTTTTAKLADRWSKSGAKVLLVAADTFRAAAVEQLKRWSDELSVPIVTGEEGSKPQAVVFDAMERVKREDFDVVLIDTAGRLHTRSNLMQELEGIKNIIMRHQPSAPHEVLLVVDGTTGQNALEQAKEFNSIVPLTGVVVTKLDGTPKGGIVVAIQDELKVPIRYIGIGEASSDLKEFSAQEFCNALFDQSDIEELPAPSAHGERRRRRREDGASLAV